MSKLLNISGKDLKLAIKNAGFTQIIAAKKLGITRQALNLWTKNDKLSEDTLHRVKRVLNIDLFGDDKGKELSQNGNITQKEIVKPLINNLSDFNDIERPNHDLGYTENSTYPERNKSTTNEWKDLYFIQQEQIRLLSKQVERLNQIILQAQ
jgi:transcriptional regulator with XRE-family HTH domain